jgi:hypothetical protein
MKKDADDLVDTILGICDRAKKGTLDRRTLRSQLEGALAEDRQAEGRQAVLEYEWATSVGLPAVLHSRKGWTFRDGISIISLQTSDRQTAFNRLDSLNYVLAETKTTGAVKGPEYYHDTDQHYRALYEGMGQPPADGAAKAFAVREAEYDIGTRRWAKRYFDSCLIDSSDESSDD